MASLTSLIAALSDAPDMMSAGAPLAAVGRAVGLDRATVIEDLACGRTVMDDEDGSLARLFGWPIDPVTRKRNHQTCPIGRACRLTSRPFAWRAADRSAGFSWDVDYYGFWRRTAAQGVYGGLSVPLHMPMSRVGVVGWMSDNPELDLEGLIETYSNELRLAAHLFMDKVQRTRRWDAELSEAAPDLSGRELECLTWVALGKTDFEIGQLIGRAASTARFHIDSAVDKLGVNNRTRAAAVATQLGMIRAMN